MGPALGVICGGTGVGEELEMEVVVAMTTAGLALARAGDAASALAASSKRCTDAALAT